MSIDNGVYILRCKDQFRVKCIHAIDNLYWSFLGEGGIQPEIVPSRVLEIFGQSEILTDEEAALETASLILGGLSKCEYEIKDIIIDSTWNDIIKNGLTYLCLEIDNLQRNEYLCRRWCGELNRLNNLASYLLDPNTTYG